jgi:hypothetical protein
VYGQAGGTTRKYTVTLAALPVPGREELAITNVVIEGGEAMDPDDRWTIMSAVSEVLRSRSR